VDLVEVNRHAHYLEFTEFNALTVVQVNVLEDSSPHTVTFARGVETCNLVTQFSFSDTPVTVLVDHSKHQSRVQHPIRVKVLLHHVELYQLTQFSFKLDFG